MADEMTEALMRLGELLNPMREFAAGERAKLLADGWSEESAEEYGMTLLLGLVSQAVEASA